MKTLTLILLMLLVTSQAYATNYVLEIRDDGWLQSSHTCEALDDVKKEDGVTKVTVSKEVYEAAEAAYNKNDKADLTNYISQGVTLDLGKTAEEELEDLKARIAELEK